MSPRAAWRLETLGFTQVYDYVGGKADWAGAGLPVEGTSTATETAADAAERDAPTCLLEESLEVARRRTRASGWDTCVVVNEHRIVLGRLGRAAIAGDDDRTVEEAMTAGPSTIRPDTPLDDVMARLRKRGRGSAVVTMSDGRLVGVIRY